MSTVARTRPARDVPIDTDPMELVPIMYEDEDEGDMGEINIHVVSDEILHVCVGAHLADRPELEVFSNMNLYYPAKRASKKKGMPYVSPDIMIVKAKRPLGVGATSYRIGKDGPAPLAVMEILSERSAQQRDLKEKLEIYAALGVAEYILVDVTGRYLAEKLLLKRSQPNRTWKNESDPDGGVTSLLGFRIIIDTDGDLRVLDQRTGKRYVRPKEAEREAEARRRAEERLGRLEAELKQLRKASNGQKGKPRSE